MGKIIGSRGCLGKATRRRMRTLVFLLIALAIWVDDANGFFRRRRRRRRRRRKGGQAPQARETNKCVQAKVAAVLKVLFLFCVTFTSFFFFLYLGRSWSQRKELGTSPGRSPC